MANTCKFCKSSSEKRGKKFVDAVIACKKVAVKYFEAQVKDFLDYVDQNEYLFGPNFEELKLENFSKISQDEESELIAEFASVFLAGYVAGEDFTGKMINQELLVGVSFDVGNNEAIEWASEHAGEMIRYINATTQKEMSELITKSILDGSSIKEVKKRILSKFSQYNEIRSALIAQQEISMAFAQGKKRQFQKYEQYFNTKGWKRNRDQGDSEVRDDHKDNTDLGWIPADAIFPATDTYEEPHGFYCRCYVEYRLTKPDELEL